MTITERLAASDLPYNAAGLEELAALLANKGHYGDSAEALALHNELIRKG